MIRFTQISKQDYEDVHGFLGADIVYNTYKWETLFRYQKNLEDEHEWEIREWCAENLSEGDWKFSPNMRGRCYYVKIRGKDNAFAFKMRWC